jgi:hypothetical protein
LREFNIVLLGKWCWRMMVDRGGLWFRVLAACNRGECVFLVEGDCEDPGWSRWPMGWVVWGLCAEKRWGTGWIRSSGLIFSWMGFHCVRGFGAYSIWW